uniref:DUF569 domain-containing protein n=1 Tax=Oryza punctata TaxID=4537 RepID=A0A0E0LRM5_ORYPU
MHHRLASLAFLATPRHAEKPRSSKPLAAARASPAYHPRRGAGWRFSRFVRLRNWWEETYVTADEDGRSVYHYAPDRRRPTHEAIWAVQMVVAGAPATQYVLLRGAYGRYLGAPDAVERRWPLSCCWPAPVVGQRYYDQPEVDSIMWRAVRRVDHVLCLHDKSGRYLRGKLSTLVIGGRPSLTVGDGLLNDDEKALLWEVLPVLPNPGRPELPISIAPEVDLAGRIVKACFPPLRREIQFVAADDDGNIGEGQVWDSFQFEGRSVQLLRNELQERVGYAITVCVRAGRHGQHSPLLINLPHSRETLHIVPRSSKPLAAAPASPAYHPRRAAMLVFQGVQFVRLRNLWEETYITADEDGRSVYHYDPDRRPSHEAIWAVQLVVAGEPPTQYVLLRGAYGRYLGAPDAVERPWPLSCFWPAPVVGQRDFDQPEVDAIMWRAVRRTGHVVCLHDKSGRYLRGKLSTLACGGRPSLTVGDGRLSDDEKALRWEVRPVLPSPGMPELPIPTEADLAGLLVKTCFPPLRREIQFVAADDDGNIVWDSFQYQGRSVQLLRNELEDRLGYAITVCVRAGRHGRLTPLLINLPHSRETLHIVVLRRNSEGKQPSFDFDMHNGFGGGIPVDGGGGGDGGWGGAVGVLGGPAAIGAVAEASGIGEVGDDGLPADAEEQGDAEAQLRQLCAEFTGTGRMPCAGCYLRLERGVPERKFKLLLLNGNGSKFHFENSLSNVLARQPMMEVFQEVEFAALRIWKSGSYLHADEDGRSPPPRRRLEALRGVGRRAASASSSASADAIVCSASGVVGGRDARGVVLLRDRYGRYLRGNKNLLAPRHSVPVKPYVENEHMFRWEVVPVPLSQARPELPIAAQVKPHPGLPGWAASLSNVLARQPMMEVFQEVEFAALRIWKSGLYLHADEDGRSIYIGSLPRAGDSRHGAVWALEPPIDAAAPLPQYVRFRGAYGRYLGAPDSYGSPLPFLSVDAAQRDRDRVEMDAIMWQPVACSGSDVVGGRDARGVVLLRDRYGRYLRGNKNLLAPRRSVPVKPYVVNEHMFRWEVVPVPLSQARPELPIAAQSGFIAACFPPLLREIEFVGEDDIDNIGEGQVWTTVENRGRSVNLLKEKLAELVGYDDFTMCVRAGRHGQYTPLLIDLPRSRETLHIVLLRTNTAATRHRARHATLSPRHHASIARSDGDMVLVSLSNVLAGQAFMGVFQGVEFRMLRIWQSGSYLQADEDGRSVYHGSIHDDVLRHNAV